MNARSDYTDPAAPKPEQERGEFVDRRPPKSPGQKIVIAGIALLAVCVLAYGALKLAGFFSGEKKPVAQLEEQKRPDSTPDFNVSLAEPPKAELRFIECAGGLKLPEGMACPETKPEAQAQAAPEPPKGPTEEEILQKRRFESEIGVGGGKPPPGGAASARARAPNLSGDTGLGGALLSTATARTLATVNRNPSFTLAKGTLPDCTLLTAISTDQPGFLKCILSRPVYSMDGKVVLMEAGCSAGICVLDANYKKLVVWSSTGKFVGKVELDKLFGLKSAWIPSFAVAPDKSLYFAVGADRGDSKVAEGLVFRVTGL